MDALKVNQSLEKLRQLAWGDQKPGVSIPDVLAVPQDQVKQLDTDLKGDFETLNQKILSILQGVVGNNKVTLAGITRSVFFGFQQCDPDAVMSSLGSFQYDLAAATSKTADVISTDLKHKLKQAGFSLTNREIRLTVEDRNTRITVEVLPGKPLTNEKLWQSVKQLLAQHKGHGHRKRASGVDQDVFRVTLTVAGTSYSVDIPESVLATARNLQNPVDFLVGHEVLKKVPKNARAQFASAALARNNPNITRVASVFAAPRHRARHK